MNWKRCSMSCFNSKTKTIDTDQLHQKVKHLTSLLHTLQTRKSSTVARPLSVPQPEEKRHRSRAQSPQLADWLRPAMSIHQIAHQRMKTTEAIDKKIR